MSEIKQKQKDKSSIGRKVSKKEFKRRERIAVKKQFKDWSIVVRARDGNKCVICQATKYIHSHHILPKEAKIFHFLRFDINNGISLCARHHKYSYEISPHKNPFVFITWLHANRLNQFDYLADKIFNIV